MRLAALALLAIAGLAPFGQASAQTPAPTPPSAQGRQRFVARFQAANVTHDGHLTLEQARAGHMPRIAAAFDAIDAGHKGYVTLDDIRTYRRTQGAAGQPRPQPNQAAGQPAPNQRGPRMAERFQAANTTRDGHLTLDQARAANMQRIVARFDAIDTTHKGYVTIEDIRAYAQAQRLASRAPQ